MITVDTLKYEATHGRKPRQPRDERVSAWAFTVDSYDNVILIRASYANALKHAKRFAQWSVTVLP